MIETASAATGSMIIWDTGEYSVLPYHDHDSKDTDQSQSNATDSEVEPSEAKSESDKLRESFQNVRTFLFKRYP